MNDKYSLKIIQNGKTQQVRTLQTGAGMSGQAVVIKATDATRFQLVNAITLVSPQKLELKRVGANLHLSLPGGDLDAPDLVIQDYFSVSGASLQGATINSEWMAYDTTGLAVTIAPTDAAGALPVTADQTSTIALGGAGAAGYLSSPWVWAGGLGLAAAAAGGGGGGGGASSVSTLPLEVMKNYTNDTAATKTVTTPTLATYTALEIKSFASLTDTSPGSRVALATTNTNIDAINSALDKLDGSTLTKEKVQALVDSYYRILQEADGNTGVNADVYNDTTNDASNAALYNDPTAIDYANIGATVGSTTRSLNLLNDVVGRFTSAKVDTVSEINDLARAAENIMAKAANAAVTAGPSIYTTDAEWVSGLTLLGFTGITTDMLTDIKTVINDTNDDGTGVDTFQELSDLFKPIIAAQTLRNYSISSSNTAPTLSDYDNAGIKAFNSLTDTTHGTTLGVDTAGLSSTILNTGLDKLDLTSLTTTAAIKARVQDMVDSYYRILSEADGVVNRTTDVDVYPSVAASDPLASDYSNIGATVGNAKSVDLLNDFVGLSTKTAVDTVDEINVVAKAAYNVMLQAGVTAGTGTVPGSYSLDADWVTGFTALGVTGVNTSNLAAVKAAIVATAILGTANDGAEVDTVQEIKELINPAIALQVLKDYANATNGVGVTAPTLTTYKDAGVKTLANLSETDISASADVDSATVTGTLGITSGVWLSTLNSALDKRIDGNTLTVAQIQSMVDSYYRILSEADGVVNRTTDVDVYPSVAASDPLASDYSNIGATVGNAKSVDLLNDFVGLSTKTAVDTVDEINVVAKAAYNVMLQAGVTAGTGTVPGSYSLDADWVTGFTALGVTGVNTSNLAAVKAAIAATSTLGTVNDGAEVDTVQEIKELINPAIALQVLKDYANATNGAGATVPTLGGLPLVGASPTSGTYTDLGIKTFKNLSDVMDVDRKYFGDASTAAGAESNTFLTAAILNSALDRLDGATLNKTKVQAMVDGYYRILREADGKYLGDSNGGGTYYDESTTAKTADTDVYNDTTNDNAKATAFNDPTLADYASIGITVADAISTTTYVATPSGIANVGGGIGNETLDLLNDAIGRLSIASVDTAGEVETLAITANDVMLMANQATLATPAPTQSDTNLIAGLNALLGLNTTAGVNTNNIASFKAALVATADTGLDVDTVNELLGVLSLVRLKDFTDDGGALGSKTSATPTLNDWALAGTGLTANTTLTDGARIDLNQATYWKTTNPSNGLSALNSALDTYSGTLVNQLLLQNIVDSYGRVLQEADGSRATSTDVKFVDSDTGGGRGPDVIQADLVFLGVNKGGDTDNATTYGTAAGQGTGLYYQKTGELLAGAIGSLASASVDTVGELNTLTGYAEAVMKHAAGVSFSYTDSEWVTALNALLNTNTSTGVNTNNIADIKSAIDTVAAAGIDVAAVDTWDELQAIVSMVRLDDYAALSTGYATPTITDYQAVATQNGVTDAYATTSVTTKSAYLASYNDAVYSQPAISSTSGVAVKDMLVAYTALLDSADGNRSTTAASLDNTGFSKIWGVTVSAGDASILLNDVINGLNTSSIDQVSELIAMASTATKIMQVAAGSAQTLSRQELTNLGLNDGAGHSFIDWNNGTGAYWITDAEWGRFTATSGVGSIGVAGATNVNSWQELQNVLNAAMIAA